MTRETAEAALAQVFRSPSSQLKIEFQGGESLLNFDLIRWIVGQAEEHNRTEGRDLAFAIATNLALIDEDVLDFCGEHGVVLSTSLDGPEDLHNRNRRRPGQDSWQRTIEGIRLIQDRLGPDYVSALMTTTEDSLDRPEEIIDAYVDLTSPAGIGIGGIVYNYDGGVYASDEGRMLAEMGDETFRLGHVEDAWSDLLGSSKLLTPLWESMTVSAPACDTCAFEQWCGADPTYHHATASDFVGHKTLSGFCARNMGVFTHLVELVDADPFVRDLLWQWGHR
jgi:sulfatase maturation enzyme AslB (radical SAM superfamily)